MELKMVDETHLETWSRSRPGFVLVNRAVQPSPSFNDLPQEMTARLEGARPDFLVASRDELEQIGIVLAHQQLVRFQKGEPILIVAGRVDHREALTRGRRQKDAVERAVQEALAVQTYVGTARLGSWLRARGGRRLALTVPELRERVMTMLADEAWVEDPNTTNAATTERRLAFFHTQFDVGGRLVSRWYPWAERPGDLVKIARKVVEESTRTMPREAIDQAVDREIAMIRFMVRCLRHATTLVQTEHAISAQVREHEIMTRHQQGMLAGAIGERPRLHQAVRAALDGDFNSADLFRSLLSHYGTLELARTLGRRGRGHDVRLDVDLARELKRLMTICDATGASLQSEEAVSDEQAAALVITQAAYELHAKSDWSVVLDRSILTEKAVVMTA